MRWPLSIVPPINGSGYTSALVRASEKQCCLVFDGKNQLEGSAHGVGDHGALLVHTADGMKEITSSEVSVRPAIMRRPMKSLPPC